MATRSAPRNSAAEGIEFFFRWWWWWRSEITKPHGFDEESILPRLFDERGITRDVEVADGDTSTGLHVSHEVSAPPACKIELGECKTVGCVGQFREVRVLVTSAREGRREESYPRVLAAPDPAS